MANIEVHSGEPLERLELRDRIFKLFSEKKYADDIVVGIYSVTTINKSRDPQPFLRVVSTQESYLSEMIEALQSLQIDIEVMILSAFHPKIVPAGKLKDTA